jgi:hypothetical protein
MQMFWMDTDPALVLQEAARTCATSPYSLLELKAIFWNEVRPAVAFNLWRLPAPEWCGFELGWLTDRILKKHRFGKPLPSPWVHRYSRKWWERLQAAVLKERETRSGQAARGNAE